jgi:CelD/BcsL family acetyltransferase involved in cellulose biosynthesis
MAVHLGMHSQHTLHWWLTTYNPELRKYSPGANLLIELARAAQARGLSRVDLGYGEEDYKNSFKNGEISTYSLVLDASALRAGFRRLAEQGKSAIKNTALEQQARKAQKLIRRR